MPHYVYILQSEAHQSEFYTGLCSEVASRLSDHNSGKSKHTSKFRPWKIVFYCCFDDPQKAVAFERYLKTGSGRAFSSKRLR